MHIVEIPSFSPPYGGEFCFEQAKALKALGHEVRVISNVQLGLKLNASHYLKMPYGRFWHEVDGIEIYQSYQRGLPKVIRPNVKRWVGIVRSMFWDYVKKHGMPDVLHAHCAKWAGYAAMMISKEYGIPYVITEHMSILLFQQEFGPAPSNAWQIALLREAYQQAEMVITVSDELTDQIAPYFGKDYKHTTISNLIDTQFFEYRKRTNSEGFHFCCVANFLPLKGYDTLFQAFSTVLSVKPNCRLTIAGPGTDSAQCRELAAQFGVDKQVKMLGAIDKQQVRELFYESNAIVLASRSEVQPLVLLEAMSTGIPYVATEVVPHNERFEGAGIIVPMDDATAFAKAMTAISETIIDGQGISDNVKKMASPAVVAKRLEQVFQEAISSKA